MPRLAPLIRDAVPEDAAELLELWAAVTPRDASSSRDLADAGSALSQLAADPDTRLVVARLDDRIVAALQLSRGPVCPLSLEQAVHSSFLLVRPEYRRHGLAHALLEEAVSWAESKDIAQVTAITDNNRDTNRFFMRLGMGSFATVRLAKTGALRKKLSVDRAHPAGNRHLIEVLAHRRSVRRRQGRERADSFPG